MNAPARTPAPETTAAWTAPEPELAVEEPPAGVPPISVAEEVPPAPSALIEKIKVLGRLVADAERGKVREALSRAALTTALAEALAAKAEAAGRARAQALGLYARTARKRRGGRRSAFIDRWLSRLGSPGQALLIARSGLWPASGRPLFDLREMAAYARRGPNPAIWPRAPLHQPWYLQAPDAAGSRRAPLVHFLIAGVPHDRSPSPLFHTSYYRSHQAQALAATRLAPFEHFVRRGAAEGRDPHPLFSLEWYLGQAADLVASGQNPLSHYMDRGWRDGLSPHPLFDPEWYVRQLKPREMGEPPLVHYLTVGWRAGLSPHPLFDGAWYLNRYPDVAEDGEEPLTHFAAAGGREGRDPGPWFDCAHYQAARGDVMAPGANPLVDYLTGGAWRVGEARPGFPTTAYLAARPELAQAGLTPLEHWARLAGPPPRTA